MLNRVLRLFRKPQTKIVVVKREACKLRVEEWKSDPALTKIAYAILNDPNVKNMLDVVQGEGPHTLMLGRATLEERAIWQARIEGFQLFQNTLESLAFLAEPRLKIEPTYEPPEPTESEKE